MSWDEVIMYLNEATRQNQIMTECLNRCENEANFASERLSNALYQCKEINSRTNKESGN